MTPTARPEADAGRVRAWFARHGARFGLSASGVRAVPVLNLGGFTNRSFHVHDGRRHLHVKLLGEGPWLPVGVYRHLEARYRAPRLLGTVEGGAIAGEALALIFERVSGGPLDPRRDPEVTSEVLVAVAALHADEALTAALGPGPRRTCAHDLVGTFVRRLQADLDTIEAGQHRLAFLPSGFCPWARTEVSALEAAARADEAFAAPARAVAHGDLHGDNVVVQEVGRWWLIDWDDLHAGSDPALDLCVLLWPLLRGGERTAVWPAPELAARVPLYRRAMLLDEVIDTLADWLEADAMPEHRDPVRGLKRTVHAEALALYRQTYGR